MIGFDRCSIGYIEAGYRKPVLRDATLLFEPHQQICVLAPPSMGKTTIANLMAGFLAPDHGQVHRHANISWPLGFAGVLHPAISGSENVKIVADLAGLSSESLLAFVEGFAELAEALYEPVQTYSSTMRAQLATSLSIAIPADTYVIDTVIGAGKPAFRAKCEVAFERRLDKSGLFFVTNSLRQAERFGEHFFLLENGKFQPANSYGEAKSRFRELTAQTDELAFVARGLSES